MTATQFAPQVESYGLTNQVLDRAGARSWIDEQGRWLISLSFRHQRAQSVLNAIAELEAAADKSAIVIWHKRWD
jgi:hypothetical protein